MPPSERTAPPPRGVRLSAPSACQQFPVLQYRKGGLLFTPRASRGGPRDPPLPAPTGAGQLARGACAQRDVAPLRAAPAATSGSGGGARAQSRSVALRPTRRPPPRASHRAAWRTALPAAAARRPGRGAGGAWPKRASRAARPAASALPCSSTWVLAPLGQRRRQRRRRWWLRRRSAACWPRLRRSGAVRHPAPHRLGHP